MNNIEEVLLYQTAERVLKLEVTLVNEIIIAKKMVLS